ncbi:hypothetical protein L6R29_24640 [Myxococcota bacterium]|nr:hypothetical protein [Myxococcota bacterium]
MGLSIVQPLQSSRYIRIFFVLFLSALGAGCVPQTKTETKPPEGLLAPRANEFNRFVRWRRYVEAKIFVDPAIQAEWLMERERLRGTDNIVEYSLRDVVYRKNGTEAWVIVVYERYLLPSPVLQRNVRAQQWKFIQTNWFFSGEVDKIPKDPSISPPSSRPATLKSPR